MTTKTTPEVKWTDPDSEGYSMLYINGQYIGYVGIGVQLSGFKTYLESIETNGFETVDAAKDALLENHRKLNS